MLLGNPADSTPTIIKVLTSSQPSSVEVVISTPSPQSGTLSPRIETQSVTLSSIGTTGLYTIYSALGTVDDSLVYRSSVDVIAHTQGGDLVDEFRKLNALQ